MNGRFDMSWRLLDQASSWDDGPVNQSADQARVPLP
ncbi:UNVERIFIED_CONTAM: phosphodiesterase, partial [Salmonella enterica subsp. enterica serovar Weltevreden]